MTYRRLTIYAFFLLLLAVGCQRVEHVIVEDLPVPSGNFIDRNLTISAGIPLTIRAEIHQGVRADELIIVMSSGRYVGICEPENISAGVYEFRIPGKCTSIAGAYLLSLVHGSHTVDQTELRIEPVEASSTIESYTGPKSVVTGSNQKAMTIAIPTDKFGNLALDAREVQFAMKYPSTAVQTTTSETGPLSWLDIKPSARSGKIFTAASTPKAHTTSETVESVPGWPQSLTITAPDVGPYADDQSFTTFTTNRITDKLGNLVADGTSVTFEVFEKSRLVAVYQSFTVGAIAQVSVRNPGVPGERQVMARVDGNILSNAIDLAFAPAVTDLPIQYDRPSRSVIVGPVTGPLGNHVRNGFKVDITLLDAGAGTLWTARKEIQEGYTRFNLDEYPDIPTLSCIVHGGGLHSRIEITQ